MCDPVLVGPSWNPYGDPGALAHWPRVAEQPLKGPSSTRSPTRGGGPAPLPTVNLSQSVSSWSPGFLLCQWHLPHGVTGGQGGGARCGGSQWDGGDGGRHRFIMGARGQHTFILGLGRKGLEESLSPTPKAPGEEPEAQRGLQSAPCPQPEVSGFLGTPGSPPR